jgi:hypothetical protein
VDELAIHVVSHVAPADTEDLNFVQAAFTEETAQSGHEFAFREITGRAEDHDDAGFGVRQWRLLELNWFWFYKYC